MHINRNQTKLYFSWQVLTFFDVFLSLCTDWPDRDYHLVKLSPSFRLTQALDAIEARANDYNKTPTPMQIPLTI